MAESEASSGGSGQSSATLVRNGLDRQQTSPFESTAVEQAPPKVLDLNEKIGEFNRWTQSKHPALCGGGGCVRQRQSSELGKAGKSTQGLEAS